MPPLFGVQRRVGRAVDVATLACIITPVGAGRDIHPNCAYPNVGPKTARFR